MLKQCITAHVLKFDYRDETAFNLGFAPMLQKKQLSGMLDEDPGLMEKREAIAKRLELYKSARDEIDSVAWK